ncbi:hypothetical protein CLU81_0574 [Flavobacterium sp. 9]|nr:hypothetical protein CLU81_0574 [Flavobacterium sp. 9]
MITNFILYTILFSGYHLRENPSVGLINLSLTYNTKTSIDTFFKTVGITII